jgi:hypothetical protein
VVAGFGLVRRSPGLAGLLAAQTISPLGDAMATTALILHVQRTTGSATAVGCCCSRRRSRRWLRRWRA